MVCDAVQCYGAAVGAENAQQRAAPCALVIFGSSSLTIICIDIKSWPWSCKSIQIDLRSCSKGLFGSEICGQRNGNDLNSLVCRYGYVYLLKHKHEVFETFKVFKSEVELQLGKKIKALRSDRGPGVAKAYVNVTPADKLHRDLLKWDGEVHTYKARLVAKGCTQTYGIDYEETFSPVADIRAIRILIAIAAYYDYEIWQMDVKTAILEWSLR
ncbi:retrotransposon protein, putative, ty1-copia subclass [Tanacetum coccineum]